MYLQFLLGTNSFRKPRIIERERGGRLSYIKTQYYNFCISLVATGWGRGGG